MTMDAFDKTSAASSLAFAATATTAAYFGYRTFASPPKSSRKSNPDHGQDSLERYGVVLFLHYYRFFVAVSGTMHTAFSIFRPRHASLMCPYPESLTSWLSEWNVYTFSALLCMIAGGALRVVAYHQLGSSYTFQLARPSGLVTKGLYSYIQHPGYTGGWTCVLGILLLFGRFDGGMGCFSPPGLVRYLTIAHVAVVVTVMATIGRIRVAEEEHMLEKNFGDTWREYNRRTSRFLPGVI